MVPKVNLAPSPVSLAFPHIQWDPLGSLRLTAQESALLRMAETNPIEYTLADSRDASMYARVLLKLLAEAVAAGAGTGEVSRVSEMCSEEQALDALDRDPLGVATHYAITKLYDILNMLISGTGVTISSVFYVGKEGILVDQWKALLRMLNKSAKGDVWAQSGASLCLALILLTACPSQKNAFTKDEKGQTVKRISRPTSYASAVEPLEALTAWIVSQLKMSSSSSCVGYSVAVAIPAMTALMNCTESRLLFAASGGIKFLARHLRLGGKRQAQNKDKKKTTTAASGAVVTSSVQQLYELTFCLWCMTYELNGSASVRADFSKDGQAVAALVDLVSLAPREKVVRVALSALRNLAVCTFTENPGPASMPTIDGHTFLTEMLACGLLKAIEHIKERQCTDPDMLLDIQVLHKLLLENYKEMSRWEVYKNEVESGHLMWGNVHTEAFFKENAKMLEGKDSDFALVKILISLCVSKDDDVAAIACYDIGEFVRHYPNGRVIAKRLGAKEVVMPLIEHENVEVQRHALQCVSKLMVQHWEWVKTQ
jgi:V-type H+-transporting ATPase subunit H